MKYNTDTNSDNNFEIIYFHSNIIYLPIFGYVQKFTDGLTVFQFFFNLQGCDVELESNFIHFFHHSPFSPPCCSSTYYSNIFHVTNFRGPSKNTRVKIPKNIQSKNYFKYVQSKVVTLFHQTLEKANVYRFWQTPCSVNILAKSSFTWSFSVSVRSRQARTK